MKILFTLLTFLCVNFINAQTFLNEQFNYGSSSGSLCGTSGVTTNWTPFLNAGTNPILYSIASLTDTNYVGGTAVGGSASFAMGNTTAESVNRTVPSISSGNVYVSFLIKPTGGSGSNTLSEYFLFFNDTFGSSLTTNYVGRLFLQNVMLLPQVKLGLSKASGSSGAVFASSNFSLGTTYLVVMKYMFITGSSTNDSVYAWFFPNTVPTTEPAPQLVATDMTVSDLSQIRSICIRQGPTTSNSALIDGIRIGTTWLNTVLPVNLVDFTAKLLNKNVVQLNWSTASEINNNYFEIENSVDNVNWTTIGKVKGNGNTNSVHNYQFSDNISNIQLLSSNIYYRIKQFDFDGKFQYSKIVSVDLKKTLKNDINIYPNPFTNNLTVNSSTPVTASIYNIEGRLILQKEISGNENINTENLLKGIYFVEIKTESDVQHLKIIKE